MFETGHAVGLVSTDRVEFLIHVGIDTVNLRGLLGNYPCGRQGIEGFGSTYTDEITIIFHYAVHSCRKAIFKHVLSGHQTEGGYSEDGKGMTIWDTFVRIPDKTCRSTTGDVAADHYHRYKEDIALMAEMGLKTYRFSVAWARIYADGNGTVNEKRPAFYESLIDECLKYHIESMVTIYHWDLPQALVDSYGGWENPRIIDDKRQLHRSHSWE